MASSCPGGPVHTVSVDARGGYHCDCEAALAHRVCWAMAAVYIAKVEHASKGRVVSPAAPPLAPPRRPRKEVAML